MTETNTNGGASVGGNVNAQGDFVGRDQTIINNIVIVGRLLEFAQVEGLFPQLKDNDFSSIVEAVEGALNKRLHTDLADAVAFAGEILNEFVEESIVTYTGKPIPLGQFVGTLIDQVGHKLQDNGYWEAYTERASYTTSYITGTVAVLKLDALRMVVAEKDIDSSSHFGIVDDPRASNRARYHLVKGYGRITPTLHKTYTICSPREYKADVLRVFIIGIVLDLIRLYSDNTISVQFLQELSNMLKSRQE